MSWRTWVRATAIRLGLAEPGSISIEAALDHLQELEARLTELRTSLLEMATTRQLYVEEAVAYDVARGNVFGATKVLYNDLVRLGIPAARLPVVRILSPLPQSVTTGVVFAPTGSVSGGALGAVRVGDGGAPLSALGGSEWAGTLGNPIPAAVIGWAALAIVVIGAAAGFTYVLIDLVNPEVAIQESIAEHDLGIAEAISTTLSEFERTRQDAIAAGIDPTTLEPPDISALEEMATGNPLLSSFSAAKGIVGGLVALAAIWVGYKVWKSAKE
jgi:hypothetical protein